MDTQTLLHWLYVGSMIGGALLFWAWSRNPKGVPQYEYSMAMMIPIWSALAYMGMANGQGKIEVSGQVTHYARYMDWVVSTPLLLLALAFTAMFYVPKDERSKTLLFGLVAADVVMILCGLFADLSESSTARLLWFVCGVGAFLAVLYVVWGPLRRIAAESDAELGGIYTKLVSFLTFLWFSYPTIWALGPRPWLPGPNHRNAAVCGGAVLLQRGLQHHGPAVSARPGRPQAPARAPVFAPARVGRR